MRLRSPGQRMPELEIAVLLRVSDAVIGGRLPFPSTVRRSLAGSNA